MRRWSFFFLFGAFGTTFFFFAALVALKTFLSLTEHHQRPFVTLLGGYLITLFFLTLVAINKEKARAFAANSENRFSNYYQEIKELHFFQKNQSTHYWNWTLGALFLGWTLYFLKGGIDHSYANHPGAAGIIFFAALLIATIGIEKQKVVDQKLIETTLKGLTIESRLALADHHYFSKFVKRRRGIWMFAFILIRVFPFLLIIFPLYHYFLFPVIKRFLPENAYWSQALPLGAAAIALGFTLITPFIKLYKKCGIRANVLQ